MIINGRRPVLLVGLDESTFHQYTFSKKCWRAPNGVSFLVPKSEDNMYMVSWYQAREFGLVLEERLTAENIAKINLGRRGNKYNSTTDAILIKGSDLKGGGYYMILS